MNKARWFLLMLGLAYVCLNSSGKLHAESSWEKQSGGFLITWSTTNLKVTELRSGHVVLEKMAYKSEEDGEYHSYRFSVQSIVGSIISLEESESGYTPGAAHAWGGTFFKAFDLSKSGQPILLTDVFSEKAVLDAFLNDPYIKNILREKNITTEPASIKDLGQVIDLGLSGKTLHSFCFHHLEGNKVAVRFMTSDGRWPPQEVVLGLIFEIPPTLKSSLLRASERSEGFLQAKKPSTKGNRENN